MVIGPGLEDQQLGLAAAMAANKHNKPLVLDGGVIDILISSPTMINGSSNCIITPNIREFQRLHNAFVNSPNTQDVLSLANRLRATICLKGRHDIIADEQSQIVYESEYSCPRRCGGQGDLLAGCIGTLLAWNKLAGYPTTNQMIVKEALNIIKRSAHECFQELEHSTGSGRSMITSDMIKYIRVDTP